LIPSCDILPPMLNLTELDPRAIDGIRLFNEGKYFEAHEVLEDAWREEPGSIRDLYQGILQVAVCYLHITRQNYKGALKMYHRSLKWLAKWPDVMLGIHVGKLKTDLVAVVAELRRLESKKIGTFDMTLLKPITYEHV
jgi:predicted metal-dependent hydrolase